MGDPDLFFHLVELGGLVVAFLVYRNDRAKEKTRQDQMHATNSARLEEMVRITREEREANKKRDEQINQLQQQTATLMEMSRGSERRLRMLEDRRAS